MRANRQAYPVLGDARARGTALLYIVRLYRIIGVRIRQQRIVAAQLIDYRLDAPYDEHGLAAPNHFHHLPRFEFRSIHGDRGAERLGARARLPGSEKWNRGKGNAYRAGANCGGRQQTPPAVVNLITHAIVPSTVDSS